MASTINASTSPAAIVQTADGTANLNLQSNGTTIAALTSTGMAVTGTLSASGAVSVAVSGATTNTLSMTGSTTAATYLQLNNTGGNFYLGSDSSAGTTFGGAAYSGNFYMSGAYPMIFWTNAAERMRIDSSGRVGINTASPTAMLHVESDSDSITPSRFNVTTAGATSKNCVIFQRQGVNVGFITVTNAATVYAVSSDYRLKENILPMTGALDTVALLKPVTYKWKIDGSDGQGFIAHELQAVVPDAVVGEKDAIDEEGNPVHQGVDTSFLVATLTAAIQEQQTLITSLTARITALEGA